MVRSVNGNNNGSKSAQWKSERFSRASREKGARVKVASFEISQAAFAGSSNGQSASVTCVAVDRLPINPLMFISSTSLKRRPMYHPRIRRFIHNGLERQVKKRDVPGLSPFANCPRFLQALYQLAPRKVKMSTQPHITEEGEKRLTCDITAIIRRIRKVHRHLKVRDHLRGKTDSIHIAIPDLGGGLKVKDLGVQVGELDRYEV